MIVHFAKINRHIKIIIAPHEINNDRLKEVKKIFGDAVFYSEFVKGSENTHVIITDNIGMLSALYSLADVAYIGGGFNKSGIHNILEAAVFASPVIFGPEYEKFKEACDLVTAGGGFSINTALELESLLNNLLNDPALSEKVGNINRKYIYEKRGATDIIVKYLQANRLLIN